jgi:hypothetical protein
MTGSRVFDGTNSIRTPASSVYNSLSQETIAFWVFPTDLTNQSVALVKDPNTLSPLGPVLQLQGGQISVFLNDGGAGSVSSTTIPTSSWSYILVTINYSLAPANTVRIYKNGIEVSYSSTNTGGSGTPSDDSGDGFWIAGAAFTFGTGQGLVGSMAELAVWNTVLSGAQITAAAASTTGIASIQSANLVGYWHLCGLTNPELDATANGNNGALVPGPSTAFDTFTTNTGHSALATVTGTPSATNEWVLSITEPANPSPSFNAGWLLVNDAGPVAAQEFLTTTSPTTFDSTLSSTADWASDLTFFNKPPVLLQVITGSSSFPTTTLSSSTIAVAVGGTANPITALSVTDTKSNTYVQQGFTRLNNTYAALFIAQSPTTPLVGGTDTVTVHYTGGSAETKTLLELNWSDPPLAGVASPGYAGCGVVSTFVPQAGAFLVGF